MLSVNQSDRRLFIHLASQSGNLSCRQSGFQLVRLSADQSGKQSISQSVVIWVSRIGRQGVARLSAADYKLNRWCDAYALHVPCGSCVSQPDLSASGREALSMHGTLAYVK
eukprot:scaffold72117_cov30-Prasinocladus_malaysianus.AAC.2